MLTSLWEHLWGQVRGEKREGGTLRHRVGTRPGRETRRQRTERPAYVDLPMGACVGTRLGRVTRRSTLRE